MKQIISSLYYDLFQKCSFYFSSKTSCIVLIFIIMVGDGAFSVPLPRHQSDTKARIWISKSHSDCRQNQEPNPLDLHVGRTPFMPQGRNSPAKKNQHQTPSLYKNEWAEAMPGSCQQYKAVPSTCPSSLAAACSTRPAIIFPLSSFDGCIGCSKSTCEPCAP